MAVITSRAQMRAEAKKHGCPQCGAAPGKECLSLSTKGNRRVRWVHNARFDNIPRGLLR